jgi:hypothetical protein
VTYEGAYAKGHVVFGKIKPVHRTAIANALKPKEPKGPTRSDREAALFSKAQAWPGLDIFAFEDALTVEEAVLYVRVESARWVPGNCWFDHHLPGH